MAPPSSSAEEAVSYTKALPPGSEQQSACMPLLNANGFAYALSASAAIQEQNGYAIGIDSLPPAPELPSQSMYLSQIHNDHGSYGPMTTYQPQQPRNQQISTSPYYILDVGQDSMACHPSAQPDMISIKYRASPVPQAGWNCSSEALLRSPSQNSQQNKSVIKQDHEDFTNEPLKHYPSESPQPMMAYPTSFSPMVDSVSTRPNIQKHSPGLLQDNSPPTLTSCANSPYEPLVMTPNLDHIKMESEEREYPDEVPASSRKGSAPPQTSVAEENTKGNVPYAKLIEKALKSAPDYRMQLQEIYNWFVQNTDKASSDGRGWQNSIRHNLSMNAAFTKTQDLKRIDVSNGDAKRSTEWKLESWAVEEGVQSTTRYRKANSSRKTQANASKTHPYRVNLRHESSKVLASHGDAWQRGAARLRGPAPYAQAIPLGAFPNDMIARQSLTTSSSAPNSAGVYTTHCDAVCRLQSDQSGDLGHPGSDHMVALGQHDVCGQPNTFGMMVPEHCLVNSLPSGVAPGGQRPQSTSDPNATTVYYEVGQAPYPYTVPDVHFDYGGGVSAHNHGAIVAPYRTQHGEAVASVYDGEPR